MPHFGAAWSSPHTVSILPMRAATGARFKDEQGLNGILGGFCPRKRQLVPSRTTPNFDVAKPSPQYPTFSTNSSSGAPSWSRLLLENPIRNLELYENCIPHQACCSIHPEHFFVAKNIEQAPLEKSAYCIKLIHEAWAYPRR